MSSDSLLPKNELLIVFYAYNSSIYILTTNPRAISILVKSLSRSKQPKFNTLAAFIALKEIVRHKKK